MRRSAANNLKRREALDRTLRLLRDEISENAPDEILVAALTETTVALVADEKNLATHSAQSAYATAAMLLARSGHHVWLAAPDVLLLGHQPPLGAGKLIEQLEDAGRDLLPGISFSIGRPQKVVDLAILFGDAVWSGQAIRSIRLNATSWRAHLSPAEIGGPWLANEWPIGGMGAAALGAAEAFKMALQRLGRAACDWSWFAQHVAPATAARIELAPRGTRQVSSLNQLDFVSGGAITNCALYALLRLPDLSGSARIIEHDSITFSNLNRGMLFRRSHKGPKAKILASYTSQQFKIMPAVSRFELRTYAELGRLADAVLVGVDDIPVRWDVQKAWPKWLGVGATTHYSAMASFHTPDLPCAGCMHPKNDDANGPIPTVAFVSFWAGLWLASFYLRHLAGNRRGDLEQHIYYPGLRPEGLWRAPVQRRPDCPVGCGDRQRSSLETA